MMQQIEPRGFDRNNRKKKTRLYLSLINIQEKEKLERRERETTIIILRLTADGSLQRKTAASQTSVHSYSFN